MNSTLLTKFLINKPFKLADSLYVFQRNSSYGRRIQEYFFNRGLYDFCDEEADRMAFIISVISNAITLNPKRGNHFDGKTYLLDWR